MSQWKLDMQRDMSEPKKRMLMCVHSSRIDDVEKSLSRQVSDPDGVLGKINDMCCCIQLRRLVKAASCILLSISTGRSKYRAVVLVNSIASRCNPECIIKFL